MAKVIIEGESRIIGKIAKVFRRSIKVTNEDGTPFVVVAAATVKKKKVKIKNKREESSKAEKMTTSTVLNTPPVVTEQIDETENEKD